MGAVWLLDLDKWLDEAGVEVDTYPGALTRSRSSGGYTAAIAVGTHHTGSSGKNPKADMDYQWGSAANRPIGAIYLHRDGKATVGACGATNTQGKGGPITVSRGVIPLNQANLYTVSIEAANPGDGTPWPDEQLRSYGLIVGALVGRLNLDPRRDAFSHATWAPGRKYDPSGPTPLVPAIGGSDGNRIWSDSAFAQFVLDGVASAPVTPTPTTGMPAPELRRGSRGPDVARLIDVLKWCHWYPAIYQSDQNDGQFGNRVEAGVLAMQQSLGVKQSGVYDVATAAALNAYASGQPVDHACPFPATSKPGDRGADVTALQQILKLNQWYPFKVDGSYGLRTEQGVQKLQREIVRRGGDPGSVDGWFGQATRDAACATLI